MAASAAAPSPAARASTIRAWCAERGLVGPVTAGDRAAGDLEGGGHDAGEVLQHAVAGELDEQRVELGVGAGEGERVTLRHGVAHDLDHVGEPLLDVLAAVAGGEAGGERLDRPAQLAQLAALVVALRPEGPPFDDVGVEQVPVADRADPRADVRPGADQALGLQDAQRLADDGAGDLEALADLLGHERAVGAQVAGDDHLAELLDELAVQSAAAAAAPRGGRPGPAPGPRRPRTGAPTRSAPGASA